mgnify:CR=1 FL=1
MIALMKNFASLRKKLKPRLPTRIYLRGGLGNQLFQYAFGLNLQIEHNRKVVFSSSLLPSKADLNEIYVYPEQLSKFNFRGKLTRSQLYKYFDEASVQWLLSRLAQADRFLGDFFSDSPLRTLWLSSDRNQSHKHLRELAPLFVNHPVMDFQIAQEQAGKISLEMGKIKNPSDWFLERIIEVEELKPIAVHVRLGDHLKVGKPSLSVEYYRGAIKLLRSKSPGSQIWIFSDQPNIAFEYLRGVIDFDRVMEPPKDSNDVESLYLMSRCSAIVISTSTFSWWAAMLSKHEGASIVAPIPFNDFPGAIFSRNFLPSEWEKIPS